MQGGGLDFSADGLLSSKPLVLSYFIVLILLLFVMVWYMKACSSKKENYYGYGMPDTPQVLASGPDVRFQEFTGTNQGSTPLNMATVKQMYPGIADASGSERLTAMMEHPVFYDISQTLGEYQYASQFNCANGQPPMPVKDSMGNMTYACADGSSPASGQQSNLNSSVERATASPSTAVQEALLMQQLGY